MSQTISSNARNVMMIAIAAAHNSTCRYRHGSVVFGGGRVLGVGWNKTRNSPLNVSDEHLDKCSVHAEIDALTGIGKMRRATCFVSRLDAFNRPTMSKPCDECWQTLLESGVTRVYWTTDNATIESAKTHADVAQRLEQATHNRSVGSSTLSIRTSSATRQN